MKKFITAFFMAWGYFLALPCPHKKWDNSSQHLMLAFLPAIGMVAGALWCLWAWFLRLFDIPQEIESLATMTFIFFISGFFHLDGFMDTCDALLSRRDMLERQRILKDSTVGAFSVISVILLISWWVVTFVFVIDRPDYWMLFLIPVISRTMSAIHVLTRKPIGHSQYCDDWGNYKCNPFKTDRWRTTNPCYYSSFNDFYILWIYGKCNKAAWWHEWRYLWVWSLFNRTLRSYNSSYFDELGIAEPSYVFIIDLA